MITLVQDSGKLHHHKFTPPPLLILHINGVSSTFVTNEVSLEMNL